MPIVLQHDETDCGPAVLATIMRCHGIQASLARIRETAGTDLSGTSLYGLAIAAEALGFRAEGVRAGWQGLVAGEVPLPVIAAVVSDRGYPHFVVLHRVNRKRVVVADPAVGLRTWTAEEFLARWRGPPAQPEEDPRGGALLILTASPKLAHNTDRTKAARLWSLVKPRVPLLLEAMLCAVLGALLALSASFFVQLLIDRVVVYSNASLLRVLGLGMVMVIVLRSAFSMMRQYLLVHLAQKIDLELFVEYFGHLLRLPMRFFRARRVGEILARLDDAQRIRSLLQGTALALALDAAMFVLAAVVLFSYHARLALVVFAFVPLFVIMAQLLRGPVRKTTREVRDSMSLVEAHLVEALTGMNTVKALGAEEWVRRQGETSFLRMTRAEFKNSIIEAIAGSAGLFLAAIASLAVLWYGGAEVLAGKLSLGQLMFFDTLLAFLLGPMERLAEVCIEVQEASVAVDRLFEILDVESEQRRDQKTLNPPDASGEFVLEDVTFAYGHRDPVLKNISLRIPAGSTVAFVGESGSGKSTLANLLVRFDDPQSGHILLDGHDLRDWDLNALRRAVGIVPQDTFLFRGRIRENIAMGNPNATLEEIADAARTARADEFIGNLPERYESLVGERACDLSGGQRQRVAIARALLSRPRVLILDEATSNLDSDNEQAIQRMLIETRGERTTVLIAHRLSTLRHADRIFVLHHGELVEEGSHDELMQRRGRYFGMWDRQRPETAAAEDEKPALRVIAPSATTVKVSHG